MNAIKQNREVKKEHIVKAHEYIDIVRWKKIDLNK